MDKDVISLQEKLIKIRNNKAFEFFVISVIIFSALMIGVKTYQIDPRLELILSVLDTLVTLIFLVEIIIRLAVEERTLDFFKGKWNVFDFLIVVASLIPVQDTEMVLLARLLRIFRVLRLISIIPELRVLINALLISIPRMGYVLLLMFIIFYIYGAIGSFVFDEINPVLWGNIAISLLTLFRVATFEDWTDVMYETMEVYPLSWIFYLTFIFLTAFVFLNMMIGIVLDVMQTEHEKAAKESGADEEKLLKEQNEALRKKIDHIEKLLISVDRKLHESENIKP
ncbi:MAG: ion transporter [Methylococcales bacterium]|jgi:voltage-gated sodium channel|nr:ion transporter [Methylococcales bacterium]MBT7411423.1 ion transporter [Methylococcales bacterium]